MVQSTNFNNLPFGNFKFIWLSGTLKSKTFEMLISFTENYESKLKLSHLKLILKMETINKLREVKHKLKEALYITALSL